MTYDQSKVCFLDLETTGLDPDTDGIWEIAVIVDGQEVVWQQALSERQIENVHPQAAEITDFHNRYDPTIATTPSSSIRRLIGLVEGRHMVGACPWFDSDRLHRVILGDIRRTLPRDLPWHYHLIDVENLAVGYIRAQAERIEPPVPCRACGATGWSYCGEDCHVPKAMPAMAAAFNLPWKSKDLSRALSVDPADFGPEHTALADARWAKAMYEAMMGDPA